MQNVLVFPKFCIIIKTKESVDIKKYIKEGVHNFFKLRGVFFIVYTIGKNKLKISCS